MSYLDPDKDITRTRHNLPHWQQGDTWIFLTYRLADSLPAILHDEWKEERAAWLAHHPQPWDERTDDEYHERFGERIDQALDQGHGSCLLKHPKNSAIVAHAFGHFDGKRYRLGCYVVMPNHVHLLFQPIRDHKLPDLVHTWKRYTAREVNKRENRSGALWQADYWDRLVRSEKHFRWAARYIERNPRNLPSGTFRLG